MQNLDELPSKQRVEVLYDSYRPYLGEVVDGVKQKLNEILKLSSQPTYKMRVKSFKSYYKKILRLKPTELFDAKGLICLTDMMGIRVICAFLEDINLAVEQIKANFEVAEVEYKGADKSFAEFGYESVHVLVKLPAQVLPKGEQYKDLPPLSDDAVCEIQIRTILQDAWAEVEHELIYKNEFTPLDLPLRRKLASLNASLSLADITFQEIRDYQNKLQREIAERRNSFYAIADNLTDDTLKPKAEENISRVSKFVSGTIDEMILAAIHAHNQGDLEEAVSIYSKIIHAEPQPDKIVLAVILKHRGMAYFSMGNNDLALQDFTQSIELDPKTFRTYYYKGIVYSIQKNYEEAIKCFSDSLKLNDFQKHTHLRRAMAYYEISDYDKALEDLNKACDLGLEENEAKPLREKLMKKFDMGM